MILWGTVNEEEPAWIRKCNLLYSKHPQLEELCVSILGQEVDTLCRMIKNIHPTNFSLVFFHGSGAPLDGQGLLEHEVDVWHEWRSPRLTCPAADIFL